MGRYWLHFFFFVLVFIGLDDIYVIKKLGLYAGLGQYSNSPHIRTWVLRTC